MIDDIYPSLNKEIETAYNIYQQTIALVNAAKDFLDNFDHNDIRERDEIYVDTEDGETSLFISLMFKNKKQLNLWFQYSSASSKITLEWGVFHYNDVNYDENKISGDSFIITNDDGGNALKIKECLKTPSFDLYNLGDRS